MFSTVPAVRVGLFDLFTAELAQDGDPRVLYSDGRDDGDFFVKVGTTTGNGSERTIRRMPHDLSSSVNETYAVEVFVYRLLRGRNDSAATRQACDQVFAVMERLDLALRRDYRLETVTAPQPNGQPLITVAHFGDFLSTDYALQEGRATDIVATVTVTAARI